jgi:glutamine---fructose-6-phosphate transaminase (isomerizing)
MCGIFAVVQRSSLELQEKQSAEKKVLAGLKKLEYRGYDSWGVAVVSEAPQGSQSIQVEKHVGKISRVDALHLPLGSVAVGHTRWATHGGVTQENAHPHFSTNKEFVLAQNGVVENFQRLKSELSTKGFSFTTQTDTEVIVRLIEEQQKTAESLSEAMRNAFHLLQGRNTIILLSQDGEVYAARNGSPLLLGYHPQHQTYVLSSDVLSFAEEVTEFMVIENGEMVEIKSGGHLLRSIGDGTLLERKLQPLKIQNTQATKGEFAHFMMKEIHDTPAVVRQVIGQPQDKIEELAQLIRDNACSQRQIYCIGSGTAGVAAAQMAYYLRMMSGCSAVSLVGADALEYLPLFQAGDILIAPSQSGETADVLEVLELAKAKGVKIVTYVNMPESTMTRLAELSFLAEAGPEICVMSTKVFTSQVAWAYLVAKTVAGNYHEALERLEILAVEIEKYLHDQKNMEEISAIATWLATKKDIFLLAKAENFQIIREGMVKLIEGSYIHAHALPAGDLKHYAITLIEEDTPVLVITSNDAVRSDVLTAAHEVTARGASVVHIGPECEGESFKYSLSTPDLGEVSSIMNVIPLQLLAYELAVGLGHDVDHPRNIAKSVTVK